MRKENDMAAYYRHSAAVIKTVRFAVLLAFVLFAVYCIGYFSSNLTEDSVRSVINTVYRSFDDLTPSETEIKIHTDDSSSFIIMHNDLAVVSNAGTELYSFSGDKLLEYDYTYSDAAAVKDGEYLLVYDISGKEVSLYNGVAKLYSTAFEYDVKAADVNSMGYFAVVNSEMTYRSGIIVYGPKNGGKYGEIFRWMSPDKYVLALSLNSNASELVCAAVFNRSGAFVTELIVYDVNTGEKKHSVELDDTMIMKLGYTDNDGSIYALADGRFLSFDKNLQVKEASEFSRTNAVFFKEAEDMFVVAESNNLSGSSMTINLFGYDAKLYAQLETDEKVLDADFADSRLYVLYKEKLVIYDVENGELSQYTQLPLDVQYKAVRADSYGRYVLIGAKNALRGSVESLVLAE